jgi:hypothetical protein
MQPATDRIATDGVFVESNLAPQNEDRGGRRPPPPEGEGGQRKQIGHQPQNDSEYRNRGLMMPYPLRGHRLSRSNKCGLRGRMT